MKAQWILFDIGRIIQTADQPLIERNGIALADVGDSYIGVFRHLCNQITNLVSLSMDLFAIMLNKNVSILNGQEIEVCSGNNGSSFLANFCTATMDMGMSGTQHSRRMAERACTPTSSTNRVTGASRL